MTANLFRQEAVDAKRDRAYGHALASRPLSFTVLTILFAALALALVAFVLLGEYTRKVHVGGYLAPSKGLVKVVSPQAGIITERRVREGSKVRQGDVLFVVNTDTGTRGNTGTQAAAIALLHQKRDSMRDELQKQLSIDDGHIRDIRERIKGAHAVLAQLDKEIDTQDQRRANAIQTLKRFRQLAASKYVAEVQVQQHRDGYLEQESKLLGLQRDRLAAEREITALKHELAESDLKPEIHRAAMQRTALEIEQQIAEYEARREIVVTAPNDGTVTTIVADAGQAVASAVPLLAILPAGGALEAYLLVPPRSAGFIVPEQTVALHYQAYPYQRFGSYKGIVKEISRTVIAPGDTGLPLPLQEPVYRVTVALESQDVAVYSEKVALQSGMLLDAAIRLDHRRLIEWILDPLFSMTGRL